MSFDIISILCSDHDHDNGDQDRGSSQRLNCSYHKLVISLGVVHNNFSVATIEKYCSHINYSLFSLMV